MNLKPVSASDEGGLCVCYAQVTDYLKQERASRVASETLGSGFDCIKIEVWEASEPLVESSP